MTKLFPFYWLLLTGLVSAQTQDAPQRLAARALGDTPIFDDLQELCDRIGGRPTGSAAASRAIKWSESKFQAAGLNPVLESFQIPNLWLPVSAEASAIAPEQFPLRLAAAPFTASTSGAIEARLVDANEGSEADFAQLGPRARGSIALIHSKEMKTFDDLFAEYVRNSSLIAAAKKAGVAALLLQSTRPRGLLYRHPLSLDGSLIGIPAAIVSREHAERLARLAGKGEVRVRLNLQNRVGGEYESQNVVAEIRGREKPDEVVLVGAHLDSWDLGTGAEDNGVNVALVLDLARGFKQLGLVPRRTIRFVLFTGEEQGMWGSRRYVERHRSELDRFAATVTFDTGSGRLLGFYLNGREDLRAPTNAALSAVSGLAATEHSNDAIDGTDNFDFLLSGVPNLVGIQDPIPYLPDYHAESDTFDRVNQREEKATLAAASVLLWGFAESPERLRRQTRTEVEKLVIDTKLDQQMKAFEQWADFVSGRRGLFK
ncbi:MAG TPA: M20/M25/M40 family metallo-hydrolase [Candidatus Sulfopaludibacter sp.]|nr:M20/M25/M40 family metallo-hydrolase [Candidatus Sulfopaludibacter sp.]